MAEKSSTVDRDTAITQVCGDRRAVAELLAIRHLDELVELDLTIHQLKVVLLVTSGVASTGRELADALHVTAPTVSATVDRLVELDYLTRVESPDDRRVRRLEPTVVAERVYGLVGGLRDHAYDLLGDLDDDDLRALAQGVRALRRAWQRRAADER
ncbi:MarR family transcriptional regulator [Pseudoclavibacter chungangensis]|uniref:MarR family transcriptional regulator n=1 Tax=Pseudoclavibacter chungangensis TaxID=587635 RepID=A0A7J5BQN7_9MICO|nr:MarR family transcriptional regulator [Pseudoclavibacter chungangensis]KAB1656334.1 MarR family transcriptional regulator [Pseudoclavibacter chungangensis]NYJ67103.1 DNA-binding MarR family transcriptional regulator [Pseudoclavibacter chungangensis]